MNTRLFSAYNLARGALLNSKLSVADSGNQPLKLLDIVVSGMGMDPTAGLWLTPLHAIPAVPRVFPFDLIYLDNEYRVLDTAEMGPGIEFPPFHTEVASALVLPSDTLRRTHTGASDRLIVCESSDLEALLAVPGTTAELSIPREKPAAAIRPSTKPPSSPVIELAPAKPLIPATSAPTTAFEQTILTAVAKVAEARNALEPKPVGATVREVPAASIGPSITVSEAVLNPPRNVQPAIVEHRIDPEDLFSNWVVTGPTTPPPARTAPPTPPAAAKSEEGKPEPAKQNGRKSSAAPKAGPESSATASAEPSKGPARANGTPAASAKDVQPAWPKTTLPARPDERTNARGSARQTQPTTTFTAVPYGMWQVSMPTAVAPMSTAKSPEAPKPDSAQKNGGSRDPGIIKSAAAGPSPISPAVPKSEIQLPPSPSSRPRLKAESTAVEPVCKAEESITPQKPTLRDQTASDLHKPGDFVASLQEKLQRAQQSRPAADPLPRTEPPRPALQPTSIRPNPVQQPTPSQQSPARETVRPISKTPPAAPAAAADSPRTAAASSPKPGLTPAPPQPKPNPAPVGFRAKFKQWLHPVSSPSDRRKAARRYVPGMVAHYFTGGAPKPHDVADISMSGMYLLTDDRWMPGTMIQMTLQKPCALGERKQSINVLSRVIRRGSDGVAAEFVMTEALSHISHEIHPSQATDKFALARFL